MYLYIDWPLQNVLKSEASSTGNVSDRSTQLEQILTQPTLDSRKITKQMQRVEELWPELCRIYNEHHTGEITVYCDVLCKRNVANV